MFIIYYIQYFIFIYNAYMHVYIFIRFTYLYIHKVIFPQNLLKERAPAVKKNLVVHLTVSLF